MSGPPRLRGPCPLTPQPSGTVQYHLASEKMESCLDACTCVRKNYGTKAGERACTVSSCSCASVIAQSMRASAPEETVSKWYC